jgi:putative membrane protein
MITYDPGRWSILFAFSCHGSVFPKAFVWACPCSLLSLALHTYLHNNENFQEIGAGDVGASVLSGFTFILGFLVVFRSQQAYSRWWEGGTLLQQLRGEWFNAFSSLMAFCNTDPEKQEKVVEFQHRLARLCSLLYCTAIQQVSTMDKKDYELIDLSDFDKKSMEYLIGDKCHDRCEVCLQWIQRLIGDAANDLVIKVAPPILSRVFNQLGNGIVNLNNARKITEFPIPFPLAQMITFMLLMHWILTAFVCAASVERSLWAVILSFIVTFSFWSINYIAVELEQPFGDDANDLPLHDMQIDLNKSLVALLDERAQKPPTFQFQERHRELARSTELIEVTFGVESAAKKETGSLGAVLGRQLTSMRSSGSLGRNGEPSEGNAALIDLDGMDGKASPAPPGNCAQRQDQPGLMVFSCSDDHEADKETAAGAPPALSQDVAHRAEPPLTLTSTEKPDHSGQNEHNVFSATPGHHCYKEYSSKDQPVPDLPSKHAGRVVMTTGSASNLPGPTASGVPCCAAPDRLDCWQLAGKDHVLQCSWDTLPREIMAAPAQEDKPVPDLPSRHAERDVITSGSVSSVSGLAVTGLPCSAARDRLGRWQLARKDHVLRCSWDTLPQEAMAAMTAQAQEARPHGCVGLTWPPTEQTPRPSLGVARYL